VTSVQHLLGELHIPERIDLLIPRQAEHLSQILRFPCGLHLVFLTETVHLLLENFPDTLVHVDNRIKHLLILALLRFLVLLQYSLIGILQKCGFRPFFEFLRRLLDVEHLFLHHAVQLLIVFYQFSRAMKRILQLEELSNWWPHGFGVLGEDCLEDRKVKLSHLEDSFIKGLLVVFLSQFACLKDGWLQRFNYHVITIYDFRWQHLKKLINFLVVGVPQLLQFIQI